MLDTQRLMSHEMLPADGADCETRLREDGFGAPAFQRAVLHGLTAIDGVTARPLAPFQIQVAHAGRVLEVRIDGLYKRYRHREIEVEHAVAEVAGALGVAGIGQALDGPFPRLVPRERVPAGAYRRPCSFDGALAIYYVRTVPSGHIPITSAEAARLWPAATGVDVRATVPADGSSSAADRDASRYDADPVDADALHRTALANLSARTADVPADSQGEGAELVIGFASGDGLDAARILIPELPAALAEWVSGELRMAIPSRDLLMVIGAADERFVADAEAHVAGVFARDPEPLSAGWYGWSAGRGLFRL